MIVLAPSTVQEAVDLTYKAFDYADRDRNPVIVLADGVIGAMMEAVVIPEGKIDFPEKNSWVIDGCKDREHRVISSYMHDTAELEKFQYSCAVMYEKWQTDDVQFESYLIEDAEIVIVSYGISARAAKTAIKELRREGNKVGLIRPITLSPFPYEAFNKLDYSLVKHIMTVEMCIPALMVEDVKCAVARRSTVSSFCRGGGFVISSDEITSVVKNMLGNGGAKYAKDIC